jgi:glucose/arabinose dehydrogenase
MNQKRQRIKPVYAAAAGLLFILFLLSGCRLGDSSEPTPTLISSGGPDLPDTGQNIQIQVVDQQVVERRVSIARVVSEDPGWVVLYSDENGAPGAVLAYAPVSPGSQQDIQVELLDAPISDRTVHARLHIDAGEQGVFEWPGPDEPVQVSGAVVEVSFRISLSAIGTAAPTPTPEASAATPTAGSASMEPGEAAIDLQLVAEGFTAPVVLTAPRSSSGLMEAQIMYVVDQVGLVWIIDGQGGRSAEPFLDLRSRMVELDPNYDERGLLGLAFSPTFAQDGRFFVYYSAPLRPEGPNGWDHTAHISEFRVSPQDRAKADPESERILLQIDQPQGNNNGGKMVFGPDNYLYIALGDGGGTGDTGTGHVEDWYDGNSGGNAQNVHETLLGKILRVDINSGQPYGIPLENPFVNQDGLDEIFAYGFRKPSSLTFDAGGDRSLYVTDVGENRWEEVNLVERGGNYGWNVREGRHCFNAADPNADSSECPTQASTTIVLIDPILEYPNARLTDGVGLAVIGGHIYRGRELTGLRGSYLFGDWSRSFQTPDGSLLVAFPMRSGGEGWEYNEIRIANRPNGRLDEYVLAFGQDNLNELYVLTNEMTGPSGETGKVYRLVLPGTARVLETPTPTVMVQPGLPSVTPSAPPPASPTVEVPTQTALPSPTVPPPTPTPTTAAPPDPSPTPTTPTPTAPPDPTQTPDPGDPTPTP